MPNKEQVALARVTKDWAWADSRSAKAALIGLDDGRTAAWQRFEAKALAQDPQASPETIDAAYSEHVRQAQELKNAARLAWPITVIALWFALASFVPSSLPFSLFSLLTLYAVLDLVKRLRFALARPHKGAFDLAYGFYLGRV
jgi:hypothetical protein